VRNAISHEPNTAILGRSRDLRRTDDNEVAAILLSFEEQGYSFRSLNSRGDVMWKASPYFLEELAGAEREVQAEYDNER
jgi:hypothetical protein